MSKAKMKEAPSIDGSKPVKSLLVYARRERKFFILIAIMLMVTAVAYPFPNVAMWLGFMFAGYSAIANDSIQTIGTFIASNQKQKWYWLWLFIGAIFLAAIFTSWTLYDGDVSFQRLQSKGLSETPTEFGFLQIAAPIILLILTRLRIPVSTTFMLLTSFSGSLGTITGMFQKSLSGYFIAFTVSIAIWFLFAGPIKKLVKGTAHPAWIVFQWITSGALWYLWIAQDAANIAVYLPRSLSLNEVLFFCAYVFAGLGLLFYLKGDKIQGIVNEKSDVTDVRSATLIDLVYAFILLWFTNLNTIPMSTTWVFIGLLAGREIGMKVSGFRNGPVKLKKTFRLIGKDIVYVTMGLFVSMILAVSVNSNIRKEVFDAVANWF